MHGLSGRVGQIDDVLAVHLIGGPTVAQRPTGRLFLQFNRLRAVPHRNLGLDGAESPPCGYHCP
jgi:hypothetical protein